MKLVIWKGKKNKKLYSYFNNYAYFFDKFFFRSLRRTLKNKYNFRFFKKKKFGFRKLYRFLQPVKIRTTALYTAQFLMGSFFSRPIKFCLTTRKRLRMRGNTSKIKKFVTFFFPL